MKNILVTGCAGFIGSNFVPYFLEKYQEYTIRFATESDMDNSIKNTEVFIEMNGER